MTTESEQLHPTQRPYHEDEIDLRELFSILWKGKWIIIAVTFVFAIASVAYALYLPNEYKATAVVQPNESGGGGKLAALAGQFGGLASLAGINLDAGESSDAVIAMEIIKSWGFAEEFITKHDLSAPLFASKKWDMANDKLVYDEAIYNTNKQRWVREPPKGKTIEPTSWELYEKYRERVTLVQDKETGLISISVTFYSPRVAKQWVDWLVQDINRYMKDNALKEADESIEYLEKQIEQTSIAEIRTVFGLIQEQHKTRMFTQVSDEYVYKVISKAKVPEEREKPNRVLICIIGTLIGGFLSLFIVICIAYFKSKPQELVKK